MKKTAFFINVSFAFCCFVNPASAQEIVLYDPSYKPAVFTDPDRIEKIKKVFPALDSIMDIPDNLFTGSNSQQMGSLFRCGFYKPEIVFVN